MTIDFSPLNFTFSQRPLVIGGKAMEYFGLRSAGEDIDLIVVKPDLEALIRQHPNRVKNLWGDLGISVYGFEIWKTIRYFDYGFYIQGAIEEKDYFLISLEKLLFQKALAMNEEKYHQDLELIVQKITVNQGKKFEAIKKENEQIISATGAVEFIEITGPQS